MPASKDVQARLSKQLASFKVSDTVVKSLADRIAVDGLSLGRFNPCMYGICVDYFTDKFPRLDVLTPKHRVAKWEVFPYGIIDWDHFHVRVAFDVDELAGRVEMGGF